jgi:hypothetical protein
MTNFGKKTLTLSHDGKQPVDFTVEVDALGTGNWFSYTTLVVNPGDTTTFQFPDAFAAHWVRLVPSAGCKATAEFLYE